MTPSQSFKIWSLAFLAVLLFADFSCESEAPGEPINRIELHFTRTDGNAFDHVFVAKDTNRDWIIDSIPILTLPPNATFNCAVSIFKDFKKRMLDLTPEIELESNEHEFEYTFDGTGLAVDSLNQENLLLVDGRQSVWKTDGTGSGTLQVTLFHANYDGPTRNQGLIDFDVIFPFKIQ